MSDRINKLILSLIFVTCFVFINRSIKAQQFPAIIYSECDGKVSVGCEIHIVRLDKKLDKKTILVNSSVSGRGEYGVSISKDSKKIAFNTYRYGGWHIAIGNIVDEKVQNIEQLTSGRDYQYNLAWAPDNKSFVYQNYSWSDNDTDLVKGTLDKVVESKIAPLIGGDRTPSYNSEGNKLLFTTGRYGTYDIVEYDFISGDIQKIPYSPLSSTRHEFAPSYSPSGNKIAYLSEHDGKLDLFLYEFGKANPKNLTNGMYSDRFSLQGWGQSQAWIYKTDWSKNGKFILFNLVKEGDSEIFIADLEKEEILQITDNSTDDFDAKWYK